jgi:hypothetical protein
VTHFFIAFPKFCLTKTIYSASKSQQLQSCPQP